MAETTDRSSLLGGQRRSDGLPESPSYTQGLQNERQNHVSRMLQLSFVAVVILMVLLTLILSIVQAAKVHGLYAMLGLSLFGLVVTVVILMSFIKYGDLPSEKAWFLYVIGGCILLEAIFTDVLLYQ